MTNTVKQYRNKRVYVGLSGGVDSAVSAALLKEAGALVTGVFIKGWYPKGLPCSWAEDRRDAMRVAAHLNIPFNTLDASHEYKKAVIDYLIREYKEGRTPNPDIFCNHEVKFGAFFDYALRNGADCVATGHYAHTESGRLYRGEDESKDQSYFLWAVPQEVLSKTLFPLGNIEKDAVCSYALKHKLPVATKKDSQGICFLGAVSIEEFLRNELAVVAGTAHDQDGRLVGKHDGAVLYTPGERVSLKDAPEGPWYVVSKNIDANTLVVAHSTAPQHARFEIPLSQTNFFRVPQTDCVYEAQYRYHGPKVRGVYDRERSVFVLHEKIHENLSEGQSLVVYEHNECLGGGIISS